jgi:hypothetical protein
MAACAQTSIEDPRLDRFGAELFIGALEGSALASLVDALRHQPVDVAGVRLFEVGSLAPFLHFRGPIGMVANSVMDGAPRPVRAILFDKTPAMNWALGWHQDRAIAVRERAEVEGFRSWTRKHGAVHVEPPFEVLADMVTLRVHLDPVSATNAPLIIAPGSHRLGRIPEHEMQRVVEACGVAVCLAEPGDIWVYATPILHASERAKEPARRRVLQIDYARRDLPGDLQWLGF